MGQDPYKPFENMKLAWIAGAAEGAVPVLAPRKPEEVQLRTPAVLLFLAAGDADSCCAANYERIVFRDQKVVELASKRFATLRIDRAEADEALLKRYGVSPKAPALLVTCNEGLVAARFEKCTNARDVLKALADCLALGARKQAASKLLLARLAKVDKLRAAGEVRAATIELLGVLATKPAPLAARERAERAWRELVAEGKALLAKALALSEPRACYDALLPIRHEFVRVKEAHDPAAKRLKELETGEETKALIHDHKGQRLIARAQALLGKKEKRGEGRALLLKVRREWKGCPAAGRADELLKGLD